ncbi:hypothetical protein AZE42_06463 [Rhizopogon vesiculosus]|uniref:Uncharacterized protein n=1 Tax=Rhizopogon vesiculosus TaxID=180088 RepID=A0A1J8QKR8_9AGAM|nr:hypothetical protein AZE42_06463 [Rhizopogon vesiculosus]
MPAMPSPADAYACAPVDACDVTSRRGACDNPTASSSPQCVTCRLL